MREKTSTYTLARMESELALAQAMYQIEMAKKLAYQPPRRRPNKMVDAKGNNTGAYEPSERGARKRLIRKATQRRVRIEREREMEMRKTLGRLITQAERERAFKSLPSVMKLAQSYQGEVR